MLFTKRFFRDVIINEKVAALKKKQDNEQPDISEI